MQQLNEIKLVEKKRAERKERMWSHSATVTLARWNLVESLEANEFFVALATSISAVSLNGLESRRYSAYLLHSFGQAQNIFKLFSFLTVILRYKITYKTYGIKNDLFRIRYYDLFLILRSSITIIGRRAGC